MDKIYNYETKYRNFLETNDSWKAGVESDIISRSDGKIRAFHIFFENPQECASGSMRIQALAKSDMINMYPRLYEKALRIPAGKFLYIFHCNHATINDQGITADTII